MLVSSLNDSDENLLKIANWIEKIKPDRVYINVPVRPPTESWVKIPDMSRIRKAEKILKGVFMGKIPQGDFYSSLEDTLDAIMSIIRRHPMSYNEVTSFSKERGENVEEVLGRLRENPNVEVVKIGDKEFFRYKKR